MLSSEFERIHVRWAIDRNTDNRSVESLPGNQALQESLLFDRVENEMPRPYEQLLEDVQVNCPLVMGERHQNCPVRYLWKRRPGVPVQVSEEDEYVILTGIGANVGGQLRTPGSLCLQPLLCLLCACGAALPMQLARELVELLNNARCSYWKASNYDTAEFFLSARIRVLPGDIVDRAAG